VGRKLPLEPSSCTNSIYKIDDDYKKGQNRKDKVAAKEIQNVHQTQFRQIERKLISLYYLNRFLLRIRLIK